VVEDCYNASPDSVCATLQALTTMGTGRKIAVLGDMLELGGYTEEGHRRCGAKAAELQLELVAVGESSRFTAEEARKRGGSVQWFATKEEAAAPLLAMLQAGDTVLFKGSHGVHMEELIERVYTVWAKDAK
jgi:UDP-N-acetylmuramoyl-tripeptide--D-alanyl-D-alanine ligase